MSASASNLKPLTLSQQEQFLWLKDAALLEKVGVNPKRSDPSEKANNYLIVKESAIAARQKLLRKAQGILSTSKDDLMTRALLDAESTGSVKGRCASYAIEKARQQDDGKFFIRLGRALALKNRPAAFDAGCIGTIEGFLVDNWCGERNPLGYGVLMQVLETKRKPHRPVNVMPPLCFFAPTALAQFCDLALELGGRRAFTNYVSQMVIRLKLKSAKSPKIKEFWENAEGNIHFIL